MLLAEDDEAILSLGKATLRQLGYTVLAAGTPAEALQVVKNHGEKIDLLVTDVVMPEMNGRDLAIILTEIISDLKCLFASGHTANLVARHNVLDEGSIFSRSRSR